MRRLNAPLTEQERALRELKRLRQQAKWHNTDPVVMTQKQFRSLRPSRNIIVVMLWLCLAAVSSIQILGGVSPNSVNHTLDREIQVSLAASLIVVCLLNSVAGWIRHSGISLGIEIFADLFGMGAFAIYTLIIIDSQEKWWAVASFAWSFGMGIGVGLRAIQIFRRGY